MSSKEMKGTLAERAAELEAHMSSPIGDAILYLSETYGKDALMFVLLKMLELDQRLPTEMLAEAAFGLVPGQVRRTRLTQSRFFSTIKRSEINALWEEDGPSIDRCPEEIRIKLRRWRMEVTFGFDWETGTLAVLERTSDMERALAA